MVEVSSSHKSIFNIESLRFVNDIVAILIVVLHIAC